MDKETNIKKFAEKLELVYELFNWRWSDLPRTPTAKEIEETIWELIEGVSKKKVECHSTGGLSVCKEENGSFEISWVLEKTIYLNQIEITEQKNRLKKIKVGNKSLKE